MDENASVEVTTGSDRPNISFNGRLLYSESSTPEYRVNNLPVASQTVYLVLSPLLFYGIEDLIGKIPSDSHIVAIEKDPALFKLGADLFQKHFSDVMEYHLAGDDNMNSILRKITAKRIRRIIPVKLNMGYLLNRQFYDSFVHVSEQNIRNFWKNRITTIHMGRLWCRNIFKNLMLLSRSQPFSALSTDKPVICAGAGESLDYSIPFILENRSRFFIVAADTAVSTFLLNGIVPDLAVVVEAQHANILDFYTKGALDIPVAADLTSSPELLRKLSGPIYFFLSAFDESMLFGTLESYGLKPLMFSPLGSVGIYALVISGMISSADIFYTGLDFCFMPEKYHSSGAPSEVISAIRTGRLNPLGFYSSAYSPARSRKRDKLNRFVYTDMIMKSYLTTLQSRISDGGRFHDIGACGLSSGYKPLDSSSVIELINTSAQKPSPGPAIPEPEALCAPGREESFLSAEIQKLRCAINSVVEFRNNREYADAGHRSELLRQLEELDYAWLFFPDNTALPNLEASFLKRFLFSAAWFEKELSNTLSLL